MIDESGPSSLCISYTTIMPRTYLISKPFILDIFRVPDTLRKIRRPLVNVNKLYELSVQVRIPERPISHQRIVEVLRITRIALQRVKLSELRLRKEKTQSSLFSWSCGRHTSISGSHVPVGSGGIPQLSTPDIGGGWR